MTSVSLLTADQVEPAQLDQFLSRLYPPAKSAFLRQHAAWQHRSDRNRWVMLVDGLIAAYCAVIPTQLWLAGAIQPALWWVDLIIDPAYRGQGLQSLFDGEIRRLAETKVGFPNQIATKIHYKHGWGVREDLQVLLLPLLPHKVKSVLAAGGLKGILLQAGALFLAPWAWRVRRSLLRYQPTEAQALENPDPHLLAAIFETFRKPQVNTTYRDSAYFQWRYLDSPHRSQYAFYLSGSPSSPTHYLIARHLPCGRAQLTRIVDLFGDFDDRIRLKDLIRLALQDAAARGSSQATILVSLPELRPVLRSLGFLLSSGSRFCWHSASPGVMNALAGNNYWTLADSDNDSPA